MTRGQYGSATSSGRGTSVGITLFHTVGDRDRAVEQIDTGFRTLHDELLTAMGVPISAQSFDSAAYFRDPVNYSKKLLELQHAKERSKLYPLWATVFSPVYQEWRGFYADQSSLAQFASSWETYEHWFDRLAQLREAIKRELPLRSPDPRPLPTTVWADAGGAITSTAGDVWTLAKVSLYGALGLGAVFVISSIVQSLRHNQDPAEKYFNMARQWRNR